MLAAEDPSDLACVVAVIDDKVLLLAADAAPLLTLHESRVLVGVNPVLPQSLVRCGAFCAICSTPSATLVESYTRPACAASDASLHDGREKGLFRFKANLFRLLGFSAFC